MAERVWKRITAVGLGIVTVGGLLGYGQIVQLAEQQAIDTINDELGEQIGKLREVSSDVDIALKDLRSKLREFEPEIAKLDDQIADLDMFREQTDDLQVEVKNIPRAADVELLQNSVADLTRQVSTLAEQVQNLADPSSEVKTDAKDLAGVIAKAEEVLDRTTQAQQRTTVYMQYTKGLLVQARDLANKLQDAGYLLPGEDREQNAEDKHEVRFFHASDSVQAEALAAQATAALRELGYTKQQVGDIQTTPLVEYGGKKPRSGLLELWIELPIRCADQQSQSSEAWQATYLSRPTERGTWHVFVASLPSGAGREDADRSRDQLGRDHKYVHFEVMSTGSTSGGNTRYGIVVAKGLRSAGLAQDIADYANQCLGVKGAYAYRQRT